MSAMVKQQMVAARETAKALVGLLDALLAEMERPEREEPTVCQHPPDKRVSTGVMGNPGRFLCGVCGVTGSAQVPAAANVAPQEG